MAPPCLHILRSWLFLWSCSSRSLPSLSILSFVRVLSMTSLLVSLFTKGVRPLRAHFSLLGYKRMEGSKALLIFFDLPKLFRIRFAQVVLQQICFGLFPLSVLFWVILGPQLLFLKDAPSRGYLSASFPIQGRLGHSRAPFYYLIQM